MSSKLATVPLALALASAFCFFTVTSVRAEDDLMAHFKQSHPRLILTGADLSQVDNPYRLGSIGARMTRLSSNAAAEESGRVQATMAFDALIKKGNAIVAEPPVVYTTASMLEISRTALKRVTTLAYLYRRTRDGKYLSRAREEMLAAASFADWHPAHFLDTAEMMDALALGYDWLYDDLSKDDRCKVAQAIYQKGLCEAAGAYAKGSEFWTRENQTNWNTVCNSSILTAALALSGDEDGANLDRASIINGPKPAALAADALARFNAGLAHYAPRGAFDEGPTYWHYSTAYAVRARSALLTACGDRFDLTNSPGFGYTGNFALDMVGSSGLLFNYADSTEKLHSAPELFWFGPDDCAFQRSLLAADPTNVSAFDLLWWRSRGDISPRKSVFYNGRAPLVVMRSKDGQKPEVFAGLLGGDNASHHSHLGLGNFVLDFGDKRFVKLLGPDNYDMPGYFERGNGNKSQAWQYYRNNSQGQNVIMFGGQDQGATASAAVVSLSGNFVGVNPPWPNKKNDAEFAVFDLTSAYARVGLLSVKRGMAHFLESGAVLLQDQYQYRPDAKKLPVQWQCHTGCQTSVQADGREVKLTNGGKSIIARILAPSAARFSVQKVDLQPPQYPTKDVSKLIINVAAGTGADFDQAEKTIAVIFLPFTKEAEDLKYASGKEALAPIKDWPKIFQQFAPEQK